MAQPSFAQQRLWLLDRLLPHGSVYNVPSALRLAGRLDVDALRRAIAEVVRRHDVLRSRFAYVADSLVLAIAPPSGVELEVDDLRALAQEERATLARRRAQTEMAEPFDLERGPLLRARLLRLDDEVHWLLLTVHHIATDAWSWRILAGEVSALYGAYRRGAPSPLRELPVQYADYAAAEREWLRGAGFDPQLDHWKRTLAGLPTLELPLDRARPPIASHRGGRVDFDIPDALTAALRELSRRTRGTLFFTLLAAFQVLLFRCSGQDDVAVGVPVAGRTQPQFEPLIGCFVNTLVLRGYLSGNPGFTAYLARVRDRMLDALSNQLLPFDKLVSELAPPRDLSRNPVVQVALNFHNAGNVEWRMPGVEVEPIDGVDTGTSKLDLTMNLSERAGRLAGHLVYASDLFDAATIARLAGHWRVLLEGIVADPECPIGWLPLLAPHERQRLLVEWNDTAADYPRERCIHQLFEAQVERSPGSPAVIFDDLRLDYRGLNARANRLAHHLQSLGVAPETRVALCAERSPEMIVALLAILKAGGAYVPLDPDYPAPRLAFMLDDAQAAVLLTQRHLVDRLPEHACPTFCLDTDWPSIAAMPEANPDCAATSANLAYVMYTSGSTGLPKGVLVEHRSVCNHLVAHAERYRPTATDRMLQTAAIAFDPSVLQIFIPLMIGARLVLPPPDAHRSPEALVDLIRRHGVTLLRVVPTLLTAIVDGPGFGRCEGLRIVFCGGESLDRELATRFFAQSRAELVQVYGPTEATVHAIHFPVPRSGGSQRLPIGRPIANTRAYVLDAQGEPAPIGVGGELCIGGAGLARGYLGAPELTAQRFVADPFAEHSGARMYRTGDRARVLADGNIEFLGRADRQVKVRGMRVELGDVEAALAGHGGVREAAVVLREDTPGGKRLVAYVVAQDDALSAAALRAHARRLLPDFMRPAAWVLLPALPRSPNGKVDPKALPAPGDDGDESAHRPPRTPLERALAGIMAAVLDVDRVGIDDDFFDLGGHSLLAMQLTNRILEELDLDLDFRQLFQTPTVHGLALAAQRTAGTAAQVSRRRAPP